jgi:hypothetical protein
MQNCLYQGLQKAIIFASHKIGAAEGFAAVER